MHPQLRQWMRYAFALRQRLAEMTDERDGFQRAARNLANAFESEMDRAAHAEALLAGARETLADARLTLNSIAEYSDYTGAERAFRQVKEMATATRNLIDAALDTRRDK